MAIKTINESALTAIGDAIRAKTESEDLLAVADMPTAIKGIKGGEFLYSSWDMAYKSLRPAHWMKPPLTMDEIVKQYLGITLSSSSYTEQACGFNYGLVRTKSDLEFSYSGYNDGAVINFYLVNDNGTQVLAEGFTPKAGYHKAISIPTSLMTFNEVDEYYECYILIVGGYNWMAPAAAAPAEGFFENIYDLHVHYAGTEAINSANYWTSTKSFLGNLTNCQFFRFTKENPTVSFELGSTILLPNALMIESSSTKNTIGGPSLIYGKLDYSNSSFALTIPTKIVAKNLEIRLYGTATTASTKYYTAVLNFSQSGYESLQNFIIGYDGQAKTTETVPVYLTISGYKPPSNRFIIDNSGSNPITLYKIEFSRLSAPTYGAQLQEATLRTVVDMLKSGELTKSTTSTQTWKIVDSSLVSEKLREDLASLSEDGITITFI